MLQVSVDTVPKICRTIGGIKSAMFIVSENPDILFPGINTSQAADEIEFNGNEDDAIFYVNFRNSSSVFTEDVLTDSQAGDYFVYILEGWIRKRRKASVDLIHALQNRTVHCVVTDRNDETTLLLYLRQSAKGSSGDKIGSPNGYRMQYRVVTPRIAPKYPFTLPSPPGDGGGDPGDGGGDPDPCPEVEELFVHPEFLTTGSVVTPPDFDSAKLVFRDNLHLVEGADSRGYTNNPGTGITLSEPARSDNPEGGEWITVVYTKTV